MKIIVLDGDNGDENAEYRDGLGQFTRLLETRGHVVSTFTLKDMKIHGCVGCYACWTRTPGICMFRDDMPAILKTYVRSDLALFASPVVMGFVTALLKRVNERLLPLTHPYFQFLDDRFQHILRYDGLPPNGLLLWTGHPRDKEFVPIIDGIFRSAVNRRHLFTRCMNDRLEATADEIDHI